MQLITFHFFWYNGQTCGIHSSKNDTIKNLLEESTTELYTQKDDLQSLRGELNSLKKVNSQKIESL